ncbi:hypothetical protein [Leeuwenhoekiella sp. MAR_2009_132]|uniref:hypothetical protein n=1 Tax=Leeuwenhoekiella sp. MAR_2009_132 TaxID=1392489 RepID=UPI000F68475E|nr:hypothetical protein [Leeuwenhoekiella sp. MAR_2009_132]
MISIPLIYIEVFFLMLTSFLIGYFFAFFYQKSKYLRKLNKLQRLVNLDKTEDDFAQAPISEEDHLEKFRKVAKLKQLGKSKKSHVKEKTVSVVNDGELDFERIGKADETDADNLQKIIGIGPFTEEKLNDIGIYTFEQISKFNSNDIEIVTELIQFFPDRIINDHWVSKAKMLAESKRRTFKEPIRMKKA